MRNEKIKNKSLCYIYIKFVTLTEGYSKAPFSIATSPRCRGGRYYFPWIAPLYLYLIMLSVKQGIIKCHLLSLWYDSTCDWTQVSRATGEHCNHYANVNHYAEKNFNEVTHYLVLQLKRPKIYHESNCWNRNGIYLQQWTRSQYVGKSE